MEKLHKSPFITLRNHDANLIATLNKLEIIVNYENDYLTLWTMRLLALQRANKDYSPFLFDNWHMLITLFTS
ncbi:hypothetical protein D0D70_02660 [Vibrio parahaemolyticus]|nr:hypothetical protein [Vibrio parahaemolyticus]KYY35155.1 hypothetical protein AWQ12_17320 [Vibrio parahaemolyticus]TOJ18033.1 hypothetical protein CGI44_20980 [Vibrio parahaemolyticus]TOJ53390.1 hypothetical protein CGI37_19700 [Vibrio parahaemolyticus]